MTFTEMEDDLYRKGRWSLQKWKMTFTEWKKTFTEKEDDLWNINKSTNRKCPAVCKAVGIERSSRLYPWLHPPSLTCSDCCKPPPKLLAARPPCTQSWALEVFFSFFNNRKWFFAFFVKLIWLGVGFLNKGWCRNCLLTWQKMQKNHFLLMKNFQNTSSAQLCACSVLWPRFSPEFWRVTCLFLSSGKNDNIKTWQHDDNTTKSLTVKKSWKSLLLFQT